MSETGTAWKYDDGEREIGFRFDMRMYDPTRDFAALLVQQLFQLRPPRDLSAQNVANEAWDCAEQFAARLVRYHERRDAAKVDKGQVAKAAV